MSSARAYVQVAVGDLWSRAVRGQSDLDAAVVQARLAITHALHQAVRSVDLVFHAAGTNAVYAHNRLERHFRDIHVAADRSPSAGLVKTGPYVLSARTGTVHSLATQIVDISR